MIKADLLQNLNIPDFQFHSGSLAAVAANILPPEDATQESLVFVSKAEQLHLALSKEAAIIIALSSLTPPENYKGAFFSCKNIPTTMSYVFPLFDGKMNRFRQKERIHPTAVIHDSAHVGPHSSIGPYVVIGENAHVGDHCTIGAHCIIESEAKVGDHTLLHGQVFIGSHCEVGARCEIHPHVTIGSDGFGFAIQKDGTSRKIPQLGKVIIGNDVEIGGNCVFDRAALTITKIGNGTKFDNLCHVAHNVQIGDNCLFAGGFFVAGSSKIGNNVMTGGHVVVADHVEICDRVVLAGRSAVTKDVTAPGSYGGFPLEPMRDSLRTLTSMTYVSHLRKQVTKIMKHLNLEDEKE
ncbi:MAG: UDP-3-O-(3-hydroxymyristoyl)glucosamine N-acyltransferase [Bdellovibrionia bacterium]